MTAPAMTLHVFNSLVPAIAEACHSLKISLEDEKNHRNALHLAYNVEWQVKTLEEAVRIHYQAFAPKSVDLDDTEWLAVAIRSSDIISYNLVPQVLRFSSPLSGESWEALRQPVPYIAFIKTGSRHFLCCVESLPEIVRVTKLITKKSVGIEPGTRIKWRGENLRARLKSGIYTYVVVFITDNHAEDKEEDKRHGFAWTRASAERFVKSHGEPPAGLNLTS